VTDQQRLYIKSLRESYGLSQADTMLLVKVYGLSTEWHAWGDADVEAVSAMLLEQGPSYARVMALAAQARQELHALQERREKQRERRAKAA
jgi:hypothetical protein